MEWNDLLSTDRFCKKRRFEGMGYFEKYKTTEFESDYQTIINSASFRRLQDKTQVFPLDKSDFVRTRLTHSLETSSIAKQLGSMIVDNMKSEVKKSEEDESGCIKRCCIDYNNYKDILDNIPEILSCAGLLHDIGNPPFGHFGETVMADWFKQNLKNIKFKDENINHILTDVQIQDLYHLEGNAQALRVLCKLHIVDNDYGMNLTKSLINVLVKYPVCSLKVDEDSHNIFYHKLGFYDCDHDLFDNISSTTGTKLNENEYVRHPLTFLLEAADDIAYSTADIEDAFVKRFLTYHSLRDELRKLQNREKKYADPEEKDQNWFCPADKLVELYDRAKKNRVDDPGDYAVKNWIVKAQGFLIGCATSGFTSHYEEIMEGTYKKDLFAGTLAEGLVKLLGEIACKCVFKTETIYRMEVKEAVMLDNLLDRFVGAAIKYDDPTQKLNSIEERLISFISNNYKKAYRYHAEEKSEVYRLYLRLLLVTDYICGMTDSYAKRLYQELNAIMA